MILRSGLCLVGMHCLHHLVALLHHLGHLLVLLVAGLARLLVLRVLGMLRLRVGSYCLSSWRGCGKRRGNECKHLYSPEFEWIVFEVSGARGGGVAISKRIPVNFVAGAGFSGASVTGRISSGRNSAAGSAAEQAIVHSAMTPFACPDE
ncbi:MAG TPA: hypothetical protein VHN55_07295 [Sphingomicrobium sp.]|nr:hypothetical protein [Sphingomicrobium sp.]